MAQKSGFFTSQLVAGVPDRKYKAEDYCDSLAVIISDGVLRSTADDLKVTASGLDVTVAAGWAWIKGHYYHADADVALQTVTPPISGSRIDRVVLRYDNTSPVRAISLVYLTGTAAASPVAPTITRTSTIYDLVLAEITVASGATSASVADTRGDAELCGWVYSTSGDGSFFTSLDNEFEEWFESVKDELTSVTLFKRYIDEIELPAASSTVTFNIPQWDPGVCFLEVFVNGLLTTDYTVSGSTLTFGAQLDAGAVVTVNAYKSIDGTGIMDVADEITELQNQFATLDGVTKYVYKTTGSDDNVSLSEIAAAIYAGEYVAADVSEAADAFLTALGGNTWLASLAADAKVSIDVVGEVGADTPVNGAGTAANPYQYFALGQAAHNGKRIIFDFAKANKFEIECAASTSNVIFYGADLELKNCALKIGSDGNSCNVQMIYTPTAGRVECEDCWFEILTTADATIATRGTFRNCYCWVSGRNGDAFCFNPGAGDLVRVLGGTLYAYVYFTSHVSAVFNVAAASTGAAIMANNINCPKVTRTGFGQDYLAIGNGGTIDIYQVASNLSVTGDTVTVVGQISVSAP